MFKFLCMSWFICWVLEFCIILYMNHKKCGESSWGFVVFVAAITALLGQVMLLVRVLMAVSDVKKGCSPWR